MSKNKAKDEAKQALSQELEILLTGSVLERDSKWLSAAKTNTNNYKAVRDITDAGHVPYVYNKYPELIIEEDDPEEKKKEKTKSLQAKKANLQVNIWNFKHEKLFGLKKEKIRKILKIKDWNGFWTPRYWDEEENEWIFLDIDALLRHSTIEQIRLATAFEKLAKPKVIKEIQNAKNKSTTFTYRMIACFEKAWEEVPEEHKQYAIDLTRSIT